MTVTDDSRPQASAANRRSWHDFDTAAGGAFFSLILTEQQRSLYRQWFEATEKNNLIGETSVSAMGMLTGLIFGNRLTRIVQCGHYAGYSLLMLGMLLQRMKMQSKVVSFDIDQNVTRFTNEWLARADLGSIATTHVIDSADSFAADTAERVLGGAPQLVFIDSSHQYRHTLEELELWSQRIEPGGFICLHDASTFAQVFDHHASGGVHRALCEWLSQQPHLGAIVIDPRSDARGDGVYRDPCGFGLVQVHRRREEHASRGASSTARRLVRDPGFSIADAWQVGDGWSFERGAMAKIPGASSSINCFAPVVAGERYRVHVEMQNVTAGGVHPAAGGGKLADFFGSDGSHTCEIVAGGENSLIGLLASADFRGRVKRFDASTV